MYRGKTANAKLLAVKNMQFNVAGTNHGLLYLLVSIGVHGQILASEIFLFPKLF